MAKNPPPTFNLLSIGHRGVGKSVFLAGSYAELQLKRQTESESIWFEGADDSSQHTIEELLTYMTLAGQYPSPTMKITDFTFRVRSRELHQYRTLCEFRWADIPGEICRLDNPDFEAMLLESHGCCVFIDAAALVRDSNYLTRLEETIKQIEVISSLAAQSDVNYFFALILTKCDQLQADFAQQALIEQKWQSLTPRLITANAVYRRFNSSVLLIPTEGNTIVRAVGTSAPFIWLITELGKIYQAQKPKNLRQCVERSHINAQHTVPPNRSESLLPKLLTTVVALGVVVGLWFGLVKLLSNPDPVQIPGVEEEPLGTTVDES
jgi:hypothetical protein